MKSDFQEHFKIAFNYLLQTRRHITQNIIAEETGVKQPHISAIATGKQNGSEKLRRKIASVYGYSYEGFLELGKKIASNELIEPLFVPEDLKPLFQKLIKLDDKDITALEAWLDGYLTRKIKNGNGHPSFFD